MIRINKSIKAYSFYPEEEEVLLPQQVIYLTPLGKEATVPPGMNI